MSSRRISGKDFYVYMSDRLVHVENCTLTIEDSRATAKTHGIPNGWVDGEVSASGDIEIDTQNFLVLQELAAEHGSWKGIPPFDMLFIASAGDHEQMKIESFGNMFKINELVNIDHKGTEKSKYKLPFEVTDSDFVKINDIPYLAEEELYGIVQ